MGNQKMTAGRDTPASVLGNGGVVPAAGTADGAAGSCGHRCRFCCTLLGGPGWWPQLQRETCSDARCWFLLGPRGAGGTGALLKTL